MSFTEEKTVNKLMHDECKIKMIVFVSTKKKIHTLFLKVDTIDLNNVSKHLKYSRFSELAGNLIHVYHCNQLIVVVCQLLHRYLRRHSHSSADCK
jgi:hypothetical protein